MSHAGSPPAGTRCTRRSDPTIPWSVPRLHVLFDAVGDLGLAALLRELGRALHNRDVLAWKVLVDVSDELLDRATADARRRIGERWLDKDTRKPLALMDARSARAAQRRSRRRE